MIKKVAGIKLGDTFTRNGIDYIIIEFVTRNKIKARQVGTAAILLININKI